ncbi:MAG: hypothetical protein Q8Q23_01290 [bacterium]|nr:hypothetical protein [bacterium]
MRNKKTDLGGLPRHSFSKAGQAENLSIFFTNKKTDLGGQAENLFFENF